MRKLFLLLYLLVIFAGATPSSAASLQIDVLEAKGVINPAMAGYIGRGIREAESHGAAMVIIQLDTPGGLDTSMRDIVQRTVSSRVPVVMYVSPPGARAASAGVFITMAAHIAAMAPNTTIGAAHPVAIGSEGQVAQLPPELEEKVVNDAVAYIKSIAAGQGRNVDWAERAVRESVAVTETEALELHVIDLVATDLNGLLSQLEGKQVTLLNGDTIALSTQGAVIVPVRMNIAERFLLTISDPNIAYILMSLGMLGLIIELSNPGSIFPGVVGGIALLLALYSLGVMEAHWGGILLMLLAFGLFIADLFVTSHGALTAGGIASLITGSLLLFSGRSSLFRIDPRLIGGVVIFMTAFFIFVIGAVVQAHRQRATTGREGLVGKVAVAQTALNPQGMVFVEGEHWTALAEEGKIEPGEEVIVTRVAGLRLKVKKVEPET